MFRVEVTIFTVTGLKLSHCKSIGRNVVDTQLHFTGKNEPVNFYLVPKRSKIHHYVSNLTIREQKRELATWMQMIRNDTIAVSGKSLGTAWTRRKPRFYHAHVHLLFAWPPTQKIKTKRLENVKMSWKKWTVGCTTSLHCWVVTPTWAFRKKCSGQRKDSNIRKRKFTGKFGSTGFELVQ